MVSARGAASGAGSHGQRCSRSARDRVAGCRARDRGGPYRPQIEEALEEFTGLPVSIGTLDLAWHPIPCLSAYDITIGEGDLRATAPRLDVFPALRALLAWRLDIASVELIEPALTLPATTKRLDSEWRRIRAQIETALAKRGDSATSSRGADLRIDRVLAEQASLRFGSAAAITILASVNASGIGAGALRNQFDAEVPSTGRGRQRDAVRTAEDGAELHGEITVSGVRLDRFAALSELLHARWQAQIALTGKIGIELRAEFEGEVRAAIGARARRHLLWNGERGSRGGDRRLD